MPNRYYNPDDKNDYHGSVAVARVNGATLGVCKKCTTVWMGLPMTTDGKNDRYKFTYEDVQDQLQMIIDEVKQKKLNGKAVISWTKAYERWEWSHRRNIRKYQPRQLVQR